MKNCSEPQILVIDESTVDSNLLTTLLSPLSKNMAAFFSYIKALEFLFYLQENSKDGETFILADDTLPPELIALKTNDHSLISKPITLQKLADVLVPLHFNLSRNNCWEYMKCGHTGSLPGSN